MAEHIKNDRMSLDQLTGIVTQIVKAVIRRSDGVFADKIASPSGLELDGFGKLRIDIGQNPSLLAIDVNGLETQFITATGAVPNVGVSAVGTGTGQVHLGATATGSVRLDVNGADTFLMMNDTDVLFGASGTSYSINAIAGLLGIIDASSGAAFVIQDSAVGANGFSMDAIECALTGFYLDFADGTPVRIQPQVSSGTIPTMTVAGATGDTIQGGNTFIKGGDTTNVANTDAGQLLLLGGLPTGTGTSQVIIKVETSASAYLTVFEAKRSGANAQLGFYGTAPVSQQAVDVGIAAVHAALVATGLITSTGVTIPVSGVPTGVVFAWTGPLGSPPSGYLICDGSAVSRTTYSALNALYSAAGYIHGNGDGATTFNLPLGTGKMILGVTGAGTGSIQGGTGGAIDHTHDVNIASTASGVDTDAGGRTALLGGAPNVSLFAHVHNTDPANTTSTTNNPPFLAEYWIVKT